MDRISLEIPNKAEYLSSLRLLVSGLLSTHGVDIETMEDLKIAVTECCNISLQLNCKENIDVEFLFDNKDVEIKIGDVCDETIKEREDLYLSTTIIDCLVDESKIVNDKLILKKHLK